MEVSTKISKTDYNSFLVDYYFYRNKFKFWFKLFVAVIAIFLLFIITNLVSFDWPVFLVVTIILLIFFYVIIIIIPFALKKLQFNKAISNLLFLNVSVNITAYASGISIENKADNKFFTWDQIKGIITSPKFICIVFKDKTSLLIPKRDFVNDNDTVLFWNKVNNGLLNAKGVRKPFQEPGSPSYLWGLIGVIPIIGAINGIIMILMGVIQYKDYKYCFIGLLGILFSFGFFKYMDYNTTHSPQMSAAYVSMAQTELNELAKVIEFYKFENNQYPDSLEQLEKQQSLVSIYDPILQFRHMSSEKATKFNYKRIGNKYTLFSSGLDEKPHTADDIYPVISIIDTSKSGFIKQ